MPLTETEERRVVSLLAEGMPATWIMEDIPMSPYTTKQLRRGKSWAIENAKEWQRVWASIRRDPVLLKLHWEFSPPTIREYTKIYQEGTG